MAPGRGTSAVFVGGGVPKDFIQITATSVCTLRGGTQASPHRAAIQITTDNTVFGGLGGAMDAARLSAWFAGIDRWRFVEFARPGAGI